MRVGVFAHLSLMGGTADFELCVSLWVVGPFHSLYFDLKVLFQ